MGDNNDMGEMVLSKLLKVFSMHVDACEACSTYYALSAPQQSCEECSARTDFMRRCAAKGLGPVVGAAPETYAVHRGGLKGQGPLGLSCPIAGSRNIEPVARGHGQTPFLQADRGSWRADESPRVVSAALPRVSANRANIAYIVTRPRWMDPAQSREDPGWIGTHGSCFSTGPGIPVGTAKPPLSA